LSAQSLSQYPNSKIAQENLDMFADSWETQINDLSIMVKEINDVCQGRGEKPVYLSLPRPGVRYDQKFFCISFDDSGCGSLSYQFMSLVQHELYSLNC
jgi:hypothetical protein